MGRRTEATWTQEFGWSQQGAGAVPTASPQFPLHEPPRGMLMASLLPRPTPKASVPSLSLPSSLSMVTSSLSSKQIPHPHWIDNSPSTPAPHHTHYHSLPSSQYLRDAPGSRHIQAAGILQGLQEPPAPRSEQQVDTATRGRNSEVDTGTHSGHLALGPIALGSASLETVRAQSRALQQRQLFPCR